MLTSYLFVDFGDNFTIVGADRTLTTTVAELRDVAEAQLDVGNNPIADTVIQGAQLTDPDTGTDYADGDAVLLTQFTFTTLERTRVIAQLQRAYLPFDVTVVDLTASGQTLADGRVVAAATSISDVITTLRANSTTSKDAYIIVASPEIGPDAENPNDDDGNFGYGGIAAWGSVLGEASDLSAGSNLHDDLALVFRFDGETIAHEAGHTYGLRHSVTDDPAPNGINDQIHTSEVMSYLSTDTSWYFTNFPMVEGDGNTDNDTLVARNGQQTPADQLFNDVNVGANADYYYITGTGAHDAITITRNGNNADIIVEAFANSDHTDAIEVPGSVVSGSLYTYSVALDRAFLIYAGLGNDKIVINGDFGNLIDIKGMSGTDIIELVNSAEASLTYTPSTNTDLNIDGESDVRGSLVFGATTVNFADFEGTSTVSVSDVATITVTGSAGQDHFRVKGISGHQGTVYGTVGITGFVNIADLIYDDVTTLNINTGADTDILTLEFGSGNPIPTTLNFDGGTGSNQIWLSEQLAGGTLLANGTSHGWNTITESSTNSTDGTIAFSDTSVTGSRTVNYDNLSLIFNSGSAAVNFVKNATAAADTITVGANGNMTGATITSISLPSVTNLDNLTINTLGDNDVVNFTSLSRNITVNGGTGTNTLNRTANVNFTLTDSALSSGDTRTVSISNIQTANLTGGAGNNTFTISGWTGAGTIDGAGGTSDTIISTKNNSAVLTNTSYTAGDGTNITLANVEVANLAGGAAANEFDVRGWNRTGSIDGNGGVDTFISVRNVNYTASDTAVSSSDGMNFTISDIEIIDLTAGGSSNTFIITPSATATFNLSGLGGSLGDRVFVNFEDTVRPHLVYTGAPHGTGYWKFGNRKNINFVGMELFDYDGNITAVKSGSTLTLSGDAVNNAVSVTGGANNTVVITGLGSAINGGTAAVTFSGVITVVANMNSGNDYVHFNNLNLYRIAFNGAAGNDRLQVGSGFIPDYNDVNSVNEAIALGSVNIRNAFTVTDSGGVNSTLLTRVTGNANWSFNGGNSVDLIDGSFTSSDSLTVNAGYGADVVNLDRHTANEDATIYGSNGNDQLTFTNGEYQEDLNISGGAGLDRIVVDTNLLLAFLHIHAGTETDTLFVGGNTITNDLTIHTDSGHDSVFIGKHTDYSAASNTADELYLRTEDGNDFVTFGPNDFTDFYADLGAGDDFAIFDAVNNITNLGTLNGYAGTNQVHKGAGNPNITFTNVTFV